MKRIIYKKENDLLISSPLLANDHYVVAILDLKNNTFEIKTTTDNIVINSGNGKSSQTLKIKAKKSLKALGVVFESEVRPKLKL